MNHISRNAPCACGSGKRYKHCHGAPGSTLQPAGDALGIAGDEFVQALSLHQNGKLAEAEHIYTRLLEAQPANAQVLHYLGVIKYQRNDFEDAERFIRLALQIDNVIPMGYNNLGLVLRKQEKLPEALACFDKALAQDPDNLAAHSNRGMILSELNRFEESLQSCDAAIRLKPDFVEAHLNRGKALSLLKRNEEAISSFEKVLALDPAISKILWYLATEKIYCCIWNSFDDDFARLLDAIASNEKPSDPFLILAFPSTPAQQQLCARMAVHPGSSRLWSGENYRHERIRIGYFSADFRIHPMPQLLAEMLEQHDRSKFEIIGISFGPNTRDSWRLRLEQAFERFYDVYNQKNAQIAALVRELEIDIAIDLMGHTRDSRSGVFALRPAPIQVNYLGFPGTMGASFIDYIIADQTLIPPEHKQFYDEKVVYLPHTYMVNDTTKRVSDRQVTRAELDLPENAFVFCCFNNTFKITPDIFDIWMRLLHAVDRSVLWLYGGGAPSAVRNLKIEAGRRGIAPERVVFAPRMELDEHLARHRQADLFLDTFYYGAHTTAMDALWAGLPVLTCEGGAFAGRVASSLLNAVGLPELITRSHAEYESLALQLATSPGRLEAIRDKLAINRTTFPLFDTAMFTRHIETAYRLMSARQRSGMPPDHIAVPPDAP